MDWLQNFTPQHIVDAWQDLSRSDRLVAQIIVGVVAVNLGLVPLVRAIRGRRNV